MHSDSGQWWTHSPLTVDAEGRANVLVLKTDKSLEILGTGDCANEGHFESGRWTYDEEVSLYRVASSGNMTIVSLAQYFQQTETDTPDSHLPHAPLPDDQGGVLAMWTSCDGSQGDCDIRASHVASGGAGPQYVIACPENNCIGVAPSISGPAQMAYSGNGQAVTAFDMTNGDVIWTSSVVGSPIAALIDGGAAVATDAGTTIVDSTGAVAVNGLPQQDMTTIAAGELWISGNSATVGIPLRLDTLGYAQPGGLVATYRSDPELDAYVLRELTLLWPLSISEQWEWGADICYISRRGQYRSYIHRGPEWSSMGEYDKLSCERYLPWTQIPPLPRVAAQANFVNKGSYHVHPTNAAVSSRPSGFGPEYGQGTTRDTGVANFNPDHLFYVGAWNHSLDWPQGTPPIIGTAMRMFKYWGPNAKDHMWKKEPINSSWVPIAPGW